MERLLLLRFGEIALKGRNRPFFEDLLLSRVRAALKGMDHSRLRRAQGRILVSFPAAGDGEISEERLREACRRVSRVFGVVSASPVWSVRPELETIKDTSLQALRSALNEFQASAGKGVGRVVRFRVASRRADKGFPITSPELNRLLGDHLSSHEPDLVVDLEDPDITVGVEVRDRAYILTETFPGPGGLPLGSSGRAVLLLSGGIDSPVAGWLSMKRGLEIEAVHFDSFPFTSERSRGKVVKLAGVLAGWAGSLRLHVVHFTEIQKSIQALCPPRYLTLIMRRMMMRLAEAIADRAGALALVTGESLGQVASQTLESLGATNSVVRMPVLRPLVTWDKEEITAQARNIGTYDLSTLPYEDCCALFVPRNPRTRPRPGEVEAAEKPLGDFTPLLAEALERTEIIDTGS